jgi:hypothetical protein
MSLPGLKHFARTSAGRLARLISPGLRESRCPGPEETPVELRPYRPGTGPYPLWSLEPAGEAARAYDYIHTFFDICPFSPDGRYLAVTRLPYADRQPTLGDTADVCVVDLAAQVMRRLYTTRAWALQLGSQAQWGADSHSLYTNDVIDGEAVAVRLSVTGEEAPCTFHGPAYHVAADGRFAVGPALDLMNATQLGYGVPEVRGRERRLPPGASADEGLWRSDFAEDKTRLLASLADFSDHLGDDAVPEGGTLYLFHSKVSADCGRIMQVLRCAFPPGDTRRTRRWVVTLDAGGGGMATAIGADILARRGHHPNWHPDGRRLVVNATPEDGAPMLFCGVGQDGANFGPLSTQLPGSGHPSVEPGDRYLVTDTYPFELKRYLLPYFERRGEVPPAEEVPLRLVDLGAGREELICTVNTLGVDGPLRLDPHPAWSRDYTRVCFNGAPAGRRRVMIADLSTLGLSSPAPAGPAPSGPYAAA